MRITKAMRDAIKNYFYNRSRARQGIDQWNKEADLKVIEAASGQWRFEAAAGTFWFTRRTERNRIVYETNERLFPEFKRTVEPLVK